MVDGQVKKELGTTEDSNLGFGPILFRPFRASDWIREVYFHELKGMGDLARNGEPRGRGSLRPGRACSPFSLEKIRFMVDGQFKKELELQRIRISGLNFRILSSIISSYPDALIFNLHSHWPSTSFPPRLIRFRQF
jgi:hypothetical protein